MYPGDGPVRENSLLRQTGAGLLPNAQPLSAQQSCWGTLKAPLYRSQVPEESLRSILPAFRLPANRLQFAFLEVHDTRAAAPREFQIPASNRIRLLSGAAESRPESSEARRYTSGLGLRSAIRATTSDPVEDRLFHLTDDCLHP